MAKNPQENSDWTSLPVLTEIVGDVPPEIPVLTEEARNKNKPAQDDSIVEMSAEEIAELLAAQLEKQLRAKLRAQFEALWQETWRQTRASLPELIRAQLTQPASAQGLGASKQPALDIIAPRPAATGSKKANNGKASSTRLNIKEPKNKPTPN